MCCVANQNSVIRLSVPSDAAVMAVVRALVDKMASLAGFDENQRGRIVLAIDEACTNIIRHQYGGRCDGRLDIETCLCMDKGLEFVLRDYGPTRDPALFRGRDLADVRPGGLGIHIIREVMDSVEYGDAPGGGMQLRLRKAIPASTD
jgi:anti-sigma regulatory factor (Ser/Thr protein kinase)